MKNLDAGELDQVAMRTLIDDLIDSQQKLQTPVKLFSKRIHGQPVREPMYRDLIPLSKPDSDEQYAFEVDLDRCTGCKACVAACHSLNGLDAGESWRDVGTIVGGADSPHWQQTLTSACHHCESPECLHGCPVAAYEKDSITGIVRHLDDQCIGCSYCILKCPFDVPKYSEKRGIVRKCDMCHQRLKQGEAPACVQACPTQAIRIVKAKRRMSATTSFKGIDFVPGCPDPTITYPTTIYRGKNVPVSARSVDQAMLRLEHTHFPLVLMLTLTQAGLGLAFAGRNLSSVLWTGVVIFFLGMVASVFHLGRPQGAWRFFLGLRTSWLSREILAFSLIAPILVVFATQQTISQRVAFFESDVIQMIFLMLSAIAIFTSVMIYVDTKRSFWAFPSTFLRFFGSWLTFIFLIDFPWLAVMTCAIKILYEVVFICKHVRHTEWSPNRHSARVQVLLMPRAWMLRLLLVVAACVVLGDFIFLSMVFLTCAELIERTIFFRAVYAPRMTSQYYRS